MSLNRPTTIKLDSTKQRNSHPECEIQTPDILMKQQRLSKGIVLTYFYFFILPFPSHFSKKKLES